MVCIAFCVQHASNTNLKHPVCSVSSFACALAAFLVVAVCLHVSEGLSALIMQICSQLELLIRLVGLPVLICGDSSLLAEDIEASGFLSRA